MRAAIREAIEGGMPAYAECGGLMYLCRSIEWEGRQAPMVGIIPADVKMHRRPAGRGYTRLRETGNGLWTQSEAGTEFNAHEFHYSGLENLDPGLTYAYEVVRGTGIDGRHDGIVYKNLLANYAHLRDVEAHHWARRFVDFIRATRAEETSA
jgi:cobyrinic acid a,c-diamide synthase